MDEAKATILVVDDEKPIRDLISRKLESEGYRCVVASDGENAVWKEFIQDFDLLIADMKLQGMSGKETLGRLITEHPDTGVILMTATADIRAAVQAIQYGAYDYLPKPFDLDDLSERVSKALERRKSALEGRAYRQGLEQKAKQLETRLQHYQNRYVEMATSRQSEHIGSTEQLKVAVGVKVVVKSREDSSAAEQADGGRSLLAGRKAPTIWDDIGSDVDEIAGTIGEESHFPVSAEKRDTESVTPPRDLQQILQLRDVSRAYRMGSVEVQALKNVTLSIARGEFIVILGPSGSGKTTLLNLIGGMDSPSSGETLVDGIDISVLSDKGLTEYRRRNIGFVFQFFNLIPTLTARENVEFAAELVERPRDTLEMLEMVGLKERADHYPSELSGGEQQRLAIARALVKDPPILLCDEPTGELDFETGKHILNKLRAVNREDHKTVLLVTHNTAIGDIADRVIRLRSGEIIEVRANKHPLDPMELKW
ncbi:MAG: ATP-binding cassette domain-containing protein [Chloroflexi bacterium]|nr:ATP-binding cassette domain-containing protein [Chloroflexota bacterium]